MFLTALLVGCTNEIQELETLIDVSIAQTHDWSVVVPDTATKVSPSRAASIAEGILLGSHVMSRAGFREISDIIPISGEDGEAQMYIVNFSEDRGYILLSASKDVYPILAFSNEGNLDPTKSDVPSEIMLYEYGKMIANSENISDEERMKIASAWTSLNTERKQLRTDSRSITPMGKPQVFYDSLNMWNSQSGMEIYTFEDYKQTSEYINMPEFVKQEITANINSYGNFNYGSIETSTLVLRQTIVKQEGEVLLKTNWVQSNGFNDKVPFVMTPDKGYIQPPLGCATVAAGQIMRYHEYPANYMWGFMDNNVASDFSASFLYELGKAMGIEYDSSESSAYIEDVMSALSKYGYTCIKKSHNLNDAISEVDARRPVYMRGQTKNESYGHAWVCDGYTKNTYTTRLRIMTLEYTSANEIPEFMIEVYRGSESQYVYGPYLHMNWGLTGVSNGFFSDSNLSITVDGRPQNFQESRYNLINIKPINR